MDGLRHQQPPPLETISGGGHKKKKKCSLYVVASKAAPTSPHPVRTVIGPPYWSNTKNMTGGRFDCRGQGKLACTHRKNTNLKKRPILRKCCHTTGQKEKSPGVKFRRKSLGNNNTASLKAKASTHPIRPRYRRRRTYNPRSACRTDRDGVPAPPPITPGDVNERQGGMGVKGQTSLLVFPREEAGRPSQLLAVKQTVVCLYR